MNQTQSIVALRLAIVFNLLAIVGTIASDVMFGDDLPPGLAVWAREQSVDPSAGMIIEIFRGLVVTVGMTLLGAIAMLCRQKWGAWCYLLGTVSGYVTMILLIEPQVSNGIVNLCDELSVLSTGLVLGIAFFSDALQKKASPPEIPTVV